MCGRPRLERDERRSIQRHIHDQTAAVEIVVVQGHLQITRNLPKPRSAPAPGAGKRSCQEKRGRTSMPSRLRDVHTQRNCLSPCNPRYPRAGSGQRRLVHKVSRRTAMEQVLACRTPPFHVLPGISRLLLPYSKQQHPPAVRALFAHDQRHEK